MEQTAKWRSQLPEDQKIVDVDQHQRFHAEELLQLREELRQKEHAHLDQLKKISEARQRRDLAVPLLRKVLYAMRDLFQGVYGDKGPRALFLEKPKVPVDSTPLRRIGRRVVGKLRDPDLKLPAANLLGTKLSRPALAREIEEPLEALETAMQELEDMFPLANETLEAKREAHAAVDQKSARLARYLEGPAPQAAAGKTESSGTASEREAGQGPAAASRVSGANGTTSLAAPEGTRVAGRYRSTVPPMASQGGTAVVAGSNGTS